MPIIKSAKKALRQNPKRQKRNLKHKNRVKTLTKRILSLAKGGDAEEIKKLLPQTYKTIDKAVKRGILKKNTASRKKSRLARLAAKNSELK